MIRFPKEDDAPTDRYLADARSRVPQGRYDPDETPKRVVLESGHKTTVPAFVAFRARPPGPVPDRKLRGPEFTHLEEA